MDHKYRLHHINKNKSNKSMTDTGKTSHKGRNCMLLSFVIYFLFAKMFAHVLSR